MKHPRPEAGSLARRLAPDVAGELVVLDCSPRSLSSEPVQLIGKLVRPDGSQTLVGIFAWPERACGPALASAREGDQLHIEAVSECLVYGWAVGRLEIAEAVRASFTSTPALARHTRPDDGRTTNGVA